MAYRDLIQEVLSDIDGIHAAALIHKTGLLVAAHGMDGEFWLNVVETFKNISKIGAALGGELHGVDVVMDKYRVAARKKENLIAVVVSTADTPTEVVDYVVYRLLEEATA